MVLSRGVAGKREKELVSMNRPIEKEVAIVQIEIGELKFGKFETSICDNRSSGTENSCNKVQILI